MISSLACDPAWRGQFIHRTENMFRRARNHACIIAWSLGNESGYGPNFAACARWIRASDLQCRPVQYEGGSETGDAVLTMGNGQTADSDIVCPMYAWPEEVERLSADGQERPVILCEYDHCLGNAGGSLATFWNELFWSNAPSHRRAQGGFIWEWIDGAISVPQMPGGPRSELGYGGDFGPTSGVLDSNFIVDGIVFPDLTPHPSYIEAKRLQQPIAFQAACSDIPADASHAYVELRVHNRYTFRSLAGLELHWQARNAMGNWVDGSLPAPSVDAGGTASLTLSLPLLGTAFRYCGLWLHIEACLLGAVPHASHGFVVAEQGFTIVAPKPIDPSMQRVLCCGSVPPLGDLQPTCDGSRVVLEHTSGSVTIRAAAYVAEIQGGHLVSLRAPGGPELLAQLPLLSPGETAFGHCFARAPTDDD